MPRRILIPVAALALLAGPAAAADAPAPGSLEDAVRLTLEREAAAGTRIAIEFPPPPAAAVAALAGCRRVEPFLPAGARLWGRTAIGVRCAEGGHASAFLPVVIKVHAQAVAAARTLPPGTVIGPEDVALAEVELTNGPGSALADPQQAIGHTVARAIPAGAAVRRESLRVLHAVSAGDSVRVVYAGPGFSVSADGKALAAAQEGQAVRVQTESGRVLTGVARPGRVVEIQAF